MGSRRRGREAALQMLFQMDVSGVGSEQAVQSYWAHLCASKEGEQFANSLVRGWSSQRDKIDTTIRDVSQHWRLERMAKVDRNILRLGTYEICYADYIPPQAAMNEAIEIAKRFGREDSPKFINGVLDQILKDTTQPET